MSRRSICLLQRVDPRIALDFFVRSAERIGTIVHLFISHSNAAL
jgi:hypothetical protein